MNGNAHRRIVRLARPHRRQHPPIRDPNVIYEDQLTRGQRMADLVARVMGSWRFIILQSFIISVWIAVNVAAWAYKWDPYPFILMNLVLSLQAAYAAPIIMMSQNRQAAKDRIDAHNDYLVNLKAEEEIRAILEHLAAQDAALEHIQRLLLERNGVREESAEGENGVKPSDSQP